MEEILHQLRLVVYPMMRQGFLHPRWLAGFQPWTVGIQLSSPAEKSDSNPCMFIAKSLEAATEADESDHHCKGDSSMHICSPTICWIYDGWDMNNIQYIIYSHRGFLLCFVPQVVWATLHCNLQRSTNLMSLGQQLQFPSHKKSWTESRMTLEKACWIFLKHVSKFVSFLVQLVFSSWFFEEQTWILALPRGLGLAAE